jgi:hypothetical protein
MFTFKRNNPTGRYKSFNNIFTDVKIKGKQCGVINEGDGFNNWSVRLIVKDEKQHCGWRWAKLKKRFASEQEARDFLKENYEKLVDGLNVVCID